GRQWENNAATKLLEFDGAAFATLSDVGEIYAGGSSAVRCSSQLQDNAWLVVDGAASDAFNVIGPLGPDAAAHRLPFYASSQLAFANAETVWVVALGFNWQTFRKPESDVVEINPQVIGQ